METDRRYQPTVDVPDALLHRDDFTSEYSIRGKFREGRAVYLDHSATTPLDPRVLDAMAPFMVCIRELQTEQCCLWHVKGICFFIKNESNTLLDWFLW
jgi:hypothetical protein